MDKILLVYAPLNGYYSENYGDSAYYDAWGQLCHRSKFKGVKVGMGYQWKLITRLKPEDTFRLNELKAKYISLKIIESKGISEFGAHKIKKGR